MIRKLVLLTATLVVAVVVFLAATLPPAPLPVDGGDPGLAPRTVPGAFHIHTTRSDGAADKAAVAAAASRAGLRFAIFTDHGDGTRVPDPPEYIDGVLCLDGVEVSTTGGHYAAVGMQPSPYPLGGDARGVVEDVARLGGFGVAAHPVSARAELAWADWSLPFDGVEWLNADSEWRDEGRMRLARTLFDYLLRPPAALAALLDRPVDALARWDRESARRRVVGIAAHDAHGGVGGRAAEGQSGRAVHVPSYEASFRAFSVRAIPDRPLTGEAAADAALLLAALRAGRFFTAVDALAVPGTLDFHARTASAFAAQGDALAGGGPATFVASASVPDGAETVLLLNGAPIAERAGGSIEFQASREGAYRVEVRLPGAPGSPPVPWLVSNPIFRLPPASSAATSPPLTVFALPSTGWRIEKSPGSDASLRTAPKSGAMSYQLAGGERASQFAALVVDLPLDLPQYGGVAFTGNAAAGQRLSVQFRFAGHAGRRWGRSVYLEPDPRDIAVRHEELAPAEGSGRPPDLQRATSVLFVVDLTNAPPGAAGEIHVADLRLIR